MDMGAQPREAVIGISCAAVLLLGAAVFSESEPHRRQDPPCATTHADDATGRRVRCGPRGEPARPPVTSRRSSPSRATLHWPSARNDGITGYFRGRKGKHDGIDIDVPAGTPVLASAAGVVRSARWNGGYGYEVVIDHGAGLRTRCAHNRTLLVRRGQYVQRGQRIALAGATGRATGPHIHYEVLMHGRHVDPLRYLP
ncbi:M23 family metallopeptidase [Candidatus Uhrbacteria bacterium]|nr:M23 family metallopeptidase [Candidatus Uhrbacteria bacterium]